MLAVNLTLNYLGVALPQSGVATNGVVGTAPGQTLTGKKGVNNYIISDGGGSTLIGGGDDDTFYVRDPNDVVVAPSGGGVDTIISWAAYYALPANVTNLILQSGSGGMGVGNNLNDLLVAEGASDYALVAGTGNDVLVGNASGDPSDTGGSTTFILQSGDGNDVISNFSTGADVVRLMNYTNLTSLSAVQAAMTQVGADVVLNLGNNETLTFRNETVAAFTAADFTLPAHLTNMTLRFSDDFSSFVSSPDGSEGWMTTGGAGWRTLSSNHEAEYYSDSSVGVDPFSDSNGVLTITAAPGTNPDGLAYNSGIITTEKSFSAEYGVWEVSAKLPAGAGLWPAIWLLPADLSWPPELDILEGLQSNTDEVHTGAVSDATGTTTYTGQWNYSGDTTNAFHTYGVDWEPNTITWYFDGNAIFTEATPADMHKAMYLLINLAVGGAGSWPGQPTSAAEFPAQMQIDSVQFYASANTTNVSGSAALAPSAPVTIVGDKATSTGVVGPSVAAITASPATGDFDAGRQITLTVTFSAPVTVAGGTPVLLLNDGGSAIYQSGSGSAALVFLYTVAAGQNTADLALATAGGVTLNGATIQDSLGDNANLAGANGYAPPGTLQIDTTPPVVASVTATSGTDDATTGDTVTITLNFSSVVTVAGGTPTLLLNDGGTATYRSGSGSAALVFTYTVATGQNAADLALAASGALALNGATLQDLAGNNATLSSANGAKPTGSLTIDTTAPVITSITTSPGSGEVTSVGSLVTLTVNFSEAVTVAGGVPTLQLNNGGVASYQSGSGASALVFVYTVASGQDTADLALAAHGAGVLNGATVEDAAGNTAVWTAANGYQPAGILQIDTNTTDVLLTGWGQSFSAGTGAYDVTGTAGGAYVSLGDGNQTVSLTGIDNTILTGSGNASITLVGAGNVVTTGSGTSVITITGSYADVTAGGTVGGVTSIQVNGFGETVRSTAAGNFAVSGPTGRAIVQLGDGNDTVDLGGSGNTVTVGVGTSTIVTGIGQGTVHAGGGADTITVAGWNNILDAGPGDNVLNGGNGNDTFFLNGANQGMDTITGFRTTILDVLDLSRTLAGAASAVTLANVGAFITSTVSGGDTTLYVDPTGGQGPSYAFAVLDGVTTTVKQLVATDSLRLT